MEHLTDFCSKLVIEGYVIVRHWYQLYGGSSQSFNRLLYNLFSLLDLKYYRHEIVDLYMKVSDQLEMKIKSNGEILTWTVSRENEKITGKFVENSTVCTVDNIKPPG